MPASLPVWPTPQALVRAQVYAAFILEYPMGRKRLDAHLQFLLANLNYEYENGEAGIGWWRRWKGISLTSMPGGGFRGCVGGRARKCAGHAF